MDEDDDENHTVQNVELKKANASRLHVFVRCRPRDNTKRDRDEKSAFAFVHDSELVIQEDEKHQSVYKFDQIFNEDATNEELTDVICDPLVSTVLAGYNASFIVYGQTGTGKTFTILSKDGVILKTIEKLLYEVQSREGYMVSLSYMQIYQDKIYDLLFNSGGGALTLREHPDEGIVIEGLTTESIASLQEAYNLLEIGKKKLIVAESEGSHFSSRSHAICLLSIVKSQQTSSNEDNNTLSPVEEKFACYVETVKSKLFLCDLAGSERMKNSNYTGRRLEETKYINTSLLELGNVIHALAARNTPHIPFRNSTLTRILKESLGGKCKAYLMICISPYLSDLKETRCSLNFGQRAMLVMKQGKQDIQPRTDSHWLRYPLSKRRKVKIDYKALSEFLSSKLKEIESAYKQEKENLHQLRKKISSKHRAYSHHEESEQNTPTQKHRSHSHHEESEQNTSTQKHFHHEGSEQNTPTQKHHSHSHHEEFEQSTATQKRSHYEESEQNTPTQKRLTILSKEETSLISKAYSIDSVDATPTHNNTNIEMNNNSNAHIENIEKDSANIENIENHNANIEKSEINNANVESIENNNANIGKSENNNALIKKSKNSITHIEKSESNNVNVEKNENNNASIEKNDNNNANIEKIENNSNITPLEMKSDREEQTEKNISHLEKQIESTKVIEAASSTQEETQPKMKQTLISAKQTEEASKLVMSTSATQTDEITKYSVALQNSSEAIAEMEQSQTECVNTDKNDEEKLYVLPESETTELEHFDTSEVSTSFSIENRQDRQDDFQVNNARRSTDFTDHPEKRNEILDSLYTSSSSLIDSSLLLTPETASKTSNQASECIALLSTSTQTEEDYVETSIKLVDINTGYQTDTSKYIHDSVDLSNEITIPDVKVTLSSSEYQQSNEPSQLDKPFSYIECSFVDVDFKSETKHAKILTSPFDLYELEQNRLSEDGQSRAYFRNILFKSIEPTLRRQDTRTSSTSSERTSYSSIDSDTEYLFDADTYQAKKSLRRAKSKYEKLLYLFEELTSEENNCVEEDTFNQSSCYELILKFKNELETELGKARQQLDSLNPDETKNLDISLREEVEEEWCNEVLVDSLQTSHSSVPLKFSTNFLPKDLNNNAAPLRSMKDDDNRGYNEQPITKAISLHNINVKDASKSSAPVSIGSDMLSPLDARNNIAGMSKSKIQEQRRKKIALAAIENCEIKKELMLTKLEKLRLEAVLSCVLMNENSDMTKEFQQLSLHSMRRLTSSRSTLSSSASCAHLPSTSQATFQSLPSPKKKYNFNDRFPASTDIISLGLKRPNISTPRISASNRTKEDREAVARSVQTDFVTQWLIKEKMTSSRSRTSSSSSEFDVSSLSDISSPTLLRRLPPCGQDDDGEGFSVDEEMDKLLLRYKKKKFSLSCLPFLRKKSFRRKFQAYEQNTLHTDKYC